MSVQNATPTWTNWFGNQRCCPRDVARVRTEDDAVELVRRAAGADEQVRAVGRSHSLTPLVNTDGIIVDLNLDASVEVDLAAGTATVPAGLSVLETARHLRAAGASLVNMGELQSATLVGAVSTGVHGTGLRLPCIAGSVLGMRLITAAGDVLEVTEGDGELMRAARISMGMLGLATEVTLAVMPAYSLREHSIFMSPGELVERWPELRDAHRHVSFFYLPDQSSVLRQAGIVPQITAALEAMDPEERSRGIDSQDVCLVSVRDIVEPGEGDGGAVQPGAGMPDGLSGRQGAMEDVLTYDFDTPYSEIEFALDEGDFAATFVELRHRLQGNPRSAHPVLVRLVAADDSLLSPFQHGPKAVFSITDDALAPYDGLLEEMESFFDPRGGLPHWGKQHTLDRARLDRLQPGAQPFREIRRHLDPHGVFLNPHLMALFE